MHVVSKKSKPVFFDSSPKIVIDQDKPSVLNKAVFENVEIESPVSDKKLISKVKVVPAKK